MTLAMPTPPTSSATAPRPRNSAVNALLAAARAAIASDGRDTCTWSGLSGLAVAGTTSRTLSTWSTIGAEVQRVRRAVFAPRSCWATGAPTRAERSMSWASVDRVHHADHLEPLAAEPDPLARLGDAESLRRHGAEHDRRVPLRRRVEEPPGGHRSAERGEQVGVGGLHRDALRELARHAVGPQHGGVDVGGRRHDLDRADLLDHRRRRGREVGASCHANPVLDCTTSRLVPRRSSSESRSARDESEMPSTATIAAMPMAMPRPESAARSRRVRRPMLPTRRRSRGCSRDGFERRAGGASRRS